ncbi:MAG: hypothetical protein ACUVX8_13595 [Candidatus Zipacnadales bacterium]
MTNYSNLKNNLSARARRVVEELVEMGLPPEDVLSRLVHEEGCDLHQAYGYVREVLWRSLLEMTNAPLHRPLRHAPLDEASTLSIATL